MDERDWWALLGPVPTGLPAGFIAVPHDRTAVLDRSYDVGPLVVRPGERRLTEYLRSEPGQLAGVNLFETWPVIVEGDWPTVDLEPGGRYEAVAKLTDQDPKKRVAALWLHRLACLLSLASGEPWQVRTTATETANLPPVVPDDWPAPPIAEHMGREHLPASPRSLPDWLLPAWHQLEHDEQLAAALTTWHQGLLLNATFPSFAMIAFCGAIEAVSQSVIYRDRVEVDVEPCTACGNVPKAHARFWATVGLVRTDEEVATLRKGRNPYSSRSQTAHGGATHGIETIFGYLPLLVYSSPGAGQPFVISLDDNDTTQRFMWREIPPIRSVARDLIRGAFASSA